MSRHVKMCIKIKKIQGGRSCGGKYQHIETTFQHGENRKGEAGRWPERRGRQIKQTHTR